MKNNTIDEIHQRAQSRGSSNQHNDHDVTIVYKASRQENASQQKCTDIATSTPDQHATKNAANTEQTTCKNKTLLQTEGLGTFMWG